MGSGVRIGLFSSFSSPPSIPYWPLSGFLVPPKGYCFFFSMLSQEKLSVVQKNRKEGQNLTVFFPSVFSRKKKP